MWGLFSGTFIRRPQYLVLTCNLSLQSHGSQLGHVCLLGAISECRALEEREHHCHLGAGGWRCNSCDAACDVLRRLWRLAPCRAPQGTAPPKMAPRPRLRQRLLLMGQLAGFKPSPPCLPNPTLLRDSPTNWTNQDKECDPEKKFHLWGYRSRGCQPKSNQWKSCDDWHSHSCAE